LTLAKRIENKTNWKLLAIPVALLVLVAVGWFGWHLANPVAPISITAKSCLPRDVAVNRANSSAATRNPGNVQVYFDASGGMAGYVAQSPNAIGNLITLTRSFASGSAGAAIEFRSFGTYRFDEAEPVAPVLVAEPTAFAKPAAYTERESRIVDVLKWIVHRSDA
jgi:hypothetical protein